MSLTSLNTLINASAQNASQFKGLSAAYGILLGGTPSIDGYTNLINANNASNFGAGGTTVFNDENIYINTVNALYQGNPTAKATFDGILAGAASVQDVLTAVYNFVIPVAARSAAGLAFFQSQASFYATRAAELGISGNNGIGVVAFASLTKIAVDSDIGGLGDTINDLRAAVANGSAAIPQSGSAFTPLETADGTQFDGDDAPAGGGTNTVQLTVNVDNLVGTPGNDTINASPTTLNAGDTINGGNGTDTLLYIDSSAAGSAPVAGVTYSSVENINIRNTAGTTTAATAEVTNISFTDLAAGATVVIAGRTVTNGTAGTITAQNVAQAFATGANVGGLTVTDAGGAAILTQNATFGAATNQVILTAQTAGVQTDFTNGGTGVAGILVTTQGAAAATSSPAMSVGAAQFTGATSFNSDLSTGAVNFTGLVAGQSVGKVGGAAAVSGAYGAAVTAANINISGGSTAGAVSVTGTGITTANITSSGAANTTGAIDVAAATTINVSAATNLTATIATTGANSTLNVSGAAASVNVGSLDTDLRTINASGLTAGGLTATLSDAAQVVTGGAGNDVISTGGLGLLTGSVNAGNGTDRLVLTATADLDTAAKGARYTGFEVLQVETGQSANLDNLAGITAIRINDAAGATAATNLSAAQAGAVTVVAATGGGGSEITIGVKGAATVGQIDTVALTIDDGVAAVNTLNLGTPVINNVEKLSINAVDNYTITALTSAASIDTITLTGAATQQITFGAVAAAANFTVNGSAATGVLTIDATNATANGVAITGGTANDILTGSAQGDALTGGAGNDQLSGLAGNDVIVGGDGNDTITGGAGADNLTGGAGVDTFTYTTLTDSTVATPATTLDRIQDFVAGTDKIDVSNAVVAQLTGTPTSLLQGAAYTAGGTGTLSTDIGNAITAGGAAAFVANGVAVVTITGTGAGTYLVINNGTAAFAAADDAVINITGITGTLAVSDFV